jgi:hypothetical protein
MNWKWCVYRNNLEVVVSFENWQLSYRWTGYLTVMIITHIQIITNTRQTNNITNFISLVVRSLTMPPETYLKIFFLNINARGRNDHFYFDLRSYPKVFQYSYPPCHGGLYNKVALNCVSGAASIGGRWNLIIQTNVIGVVGWFSKGPALAVIPKIL